MNENKWKITKGKHQKHSTVFVEQNEQKLATSTSKHSVIYSLVFSTEFFHRKQFQIAFFGAVNKKKLNKSCIRSVWFGCF